MTNALTATKTLKLSSQRVPDVILVLNKEETKRKKYNQQKRTTKKHNKEKETHTQAKAHAHAHAQAQAKAHTSKKAHAATRSRFYIIVEKIEFRKTNM